MTYSASPLCESVPYEERIKKGQDISYAFREETPCELRVSPIHTTTIYFICFCNFGVPAVSFPCLEKCKISKKMASFLCM